MGLIYPQLKGMLEASIRKVTVRVIWSEGPLERDVTVTQYITNPQQGGLLSVDESMAAGAGGGSGVGTRTASRRGWYGGGMSAVSVAPRPCAPRPRMGARRAARALSRSSSS